MAHQKEKVKCDHKGHYLWDIMKSDFNRRNTYVRNELGMGPAALPQLEKLMSDVSPIKIESEDSENYHP